MRKIQVHMRVNVLKKFELVVPDKLDPRDFANKVIAKDPACKHHRVTNVHYDQDSEMPISVQFFLKQERKVLLQKCHPINMQCLKLALYIAPDAGPLEAYQKLIKQVYKDGTILADCVISMAEPFQNRFTVCELLAMSQMHDG